VGFALYAKTTLGVSFWGKAKMKFSWELAQWLYYLTRNNCPMSRRYARYRK